MFCFSRKVYASVCIIRSIRMFVNFVYVDCLRVIAPVEEIQIEEVPVSQGTVNDHTPMLPSDPPTMNTIPQQSSVTGSNLSTPSTTGTHVCTCVCMHACMYV